MASMIPPAISLLQGNREKAIMQLKQSITACEAADLRAHHHIAKYRLGQLLGGNGGFELLGEAKQWMRKEGIINPPRFVQMMAPGFRTLEGSGQS